MTRCLACTLWQSSQTHLSFDRCLHFQPWPRPQYPPPFSQECKKRWNKSSGSPISHSRYKCQTLNLMFSHFFLVGTAYPPSRRARRIGPRTQAPCPACPSGLLPCLRPKKLDHTPLTPSSSCPQTSRCRRLQLQVSHVPGCHRL